MIQPYTKARGFTFVEVVSAMAISGAVALLSLPMVDEFQQKRIAAGMQDEFTGALALARSSAATLGQTVALCPSADGERCASGRWGQGWLVYVEQPSADDAAAQPHKLHSYTLDDSETFLAVVDEQQQSVDAIRFDPRGFNLAEQRIAASVCSEGEVKQWDAVTVERSGRVRVSAGQAVEANAQVSGAAAICNS